MNVTQLVAAVQNNGFSFTPPASGPADPTNPVLIALNQAYRTVCGAQRWPFLEKFDKSIVTVAGTQSYALSLIADMRQLDAVRITDSLGNNYDLTNMDPQTFKSSTFTMTSTPVQTGLPLYWTQHAGMIRLFPIPDGVYTLNIDYVYAPPDLLNATDTPVIPAQWHDVLVWGAIQYLSFRERNIWAQELAQGYFRDVYGKMQDEYLLMQRQTSSKVKKSGFYDYDSTNEFLISGGS